MQTIRAHCGARTGIEEKSERKKRPNGKADRKKEKKHELKYYTRWLELAESRTCPF